ncbi:hypothetical protein BpHYR1_002362 [Brachionus plicatilis]|uniref:Uncharacterized protein n=1 Tax=Brachionus plicatilis TaxID=10195 RepID=A0A3M7Q908_BRAPC|nr:hypothetical protein BpHYR1_002362 [Brachionus plicatilis]
MLRERDIFLWCQQQSWKEFEKLEKKVFNFKYENVIDKVLNKNGGWSDCLTYLFKNCYKVELNTSKFTLFA